MGLHQSIHLCFHLCLLYQCLIDTLGNTGVTVFLAIMVVLAALISGFGKKWDYHVGRRHLPITGPSSVPTGVVYLPMLLDSIQLRRRRMSQRRRKLMPVQEKQEGEETPDEIPIEDNQDNTISSN